MSIRQVWKELDLKAMHQAYRKAISKISKQITHENRELFPQKDETVVLAEYGGVTLSMVIDSEHKIIKASHWGGQCEYRAILERCCEIVEGLSVAEARDHGVIRLEHSLRDPNMRPPVQGVVTPLNADLHFISVQKLLRKSCHKYLGDGSHSLNEWQDIPSSNWSQLSNKEKIKELEKIIQNIKKGILDDDVRVMDIQRGTRVVLSCGPMKEAIGHFLLVLERELKNTLDPQIEVLVEEKEDRNKRKRLVGSGKKTESSIFTGPSLPNV